MSLDDELIEAHARGDGRLLVALYQQAAEAAPSDQMAAFYLTHAHVFAMETDHPDTAALRQQLIEAGCEGPLLPPLPPLR